jgi:hypothetical protein
METTMTIEDSEHHRKVQIEQAAIGCVSGTLAEWPHLLSALRFYGKEASRFDDALVAKRLAQEVCEEQGWLPFIRSL